MPARDPVGGEGRKQRQNADRKRNPGQRPHEHRIQTDQGRQHADGRKVRCIPRQPEFDGFAKHATEQQLGQAAVWRLGQLVDETVIAVVGNDHRARNEWTLAQRRQCSLKCEGIVR